MTRLKFPPHGGLVFCIALAVGPLQAQDTFSIVAVDVATGQVGSAGATCLDDDDITGGAIIISDVIPDIGAINTQSYWVPLNQQNAHDQMVGGLSPTELMTWLEDNDVQNNPGIRQYGAADLVTGAPRSAGFTGEECFDWNGHLIGEGYAIQGNILLGEEILDGMELGFLSVEGPLAYRLMAAMQGANVAGADTRCLLEGVSSRSAFLRVAYPGDDPNNLTIDLNVSITPDGVEPIDELQLLFDDWLQPNTAQEETLETNQIFWLYDQPGTNTLQVVWANDQPAILRLTAMSGQEVGVFALRSRQNTIQVTGFTPGFYIAQVVNLEGKILATRKWIHSNP